MYFENSTTCFQVRTALFLGIFLKPSYFKEIGEVKTPLYKGGGPHYVRIHFKMK